MQKLQEVLNEQKEKQEHTYLDHTIITGLSLNYDLIKTLTFIVISNTDEFTVMSEINKDMKRSKLIKIMGKTDLSLGKMLSGDDLLNTIKGLEVKDGSSNYLVMA